jgi:hypothetical protein
VKEEIDKLMENLEFKETTTQDLEEDIILVTSHK